jgi:hypothetical protein
MAADVRSHEEDEERFSQVGLSPGQWFSPYFTMRNIAELVLHSYLLSQRLPAAETVEFRCEWSGLRERKLADVESALLGPRKWSGMARTDHLITVKEWPVSDLTRSWPEVVSALGGPAIRLFEPAFDYPAWITTQIDRLKRG